MHSHHWVSAFPAQEAQAASVARSGTTIDGVAWAGGVAPGPAKLCRRSTHTVVQPNCGCHSGSSHSTGFAFAGDQATLYSVWVGAMASQPSTSMQRVRTGDANQSYVMHKLDGTHASAGGSGSQMPLSGCCLDADTRDAIRDWINEGAPDN